MTKSFRRNVCLIAGALVLSVTSVKADVIFSNTTNDLAFRFEPGTQQVGDEILTTAPGFLTNFSFSYYWTPTGATDPAEGRVQFYRMDGPLFNGYRSPGTSLFDSGWFSMGTPTTRSTMQFLAGLDFPLNGLYIPVTDLTWSIQFRNFGDDHIGVDLFSPPTVGSDFPDYWANSISGWSLQTNSVPMNFGARFEANIPEPSSLSLLILGGIGSLLFARRNRQ